MSLTWPDHPITLAEWEALPENGDLRLEVTEGMLVVSAKPMFGHQRACLCLTARLDEALPGDLIALSDVEVMLEESPLTIRAPDVVVMRTDVYEPTRARADVAEVLLAVEILSDGTRRIDRVLKYSEYADAGIRQYWLVDLLDQVTLTTFQLVDGGYELTGEWTGSASPLVAGVPVTLDLDRLTAR
ncbi:Uma2 family endonuclease [Pseudonocardia sp. RS010]|uniref:Uma2 family endonuclease n=1 Tax=Pseudonocardia sp. RS010 TaxID=3385979 RepID=UPI0039A1B1E6